MLLVRILPVAAQFEWPDLELLIAHGATAKKNNAVQNVGNAKVSRLKEIYR